MLPVIDAPDAPVRRRLGLGGLLASSLRVRSNGVPACLSTEGYAFIRAGILTISIVPPAPSKQIRIACPFPMTNSISSS
ncbi:MAG: hypothetical protein ACR2LF_03335 [Jatrophihabitantaceae bacterium]